MMITAEIAGYAHDTEFKCDDCVRIWATNELKRALGSAYFGFYCWTTEDLLHALAGVLELDRDYVDSEDFPVPFSRETAYTDAYRADIDNEPRPVCKCGDDFLGEF